MIGLTIYLTALIIWLLRETDWLRVNLMPIVKPKRKWQFAKYGGDCVMMRDRCYIDQVNNRCNLCRGDRFFAWRIPARTVKLYSSTINFKEGCNLYRAKLIKDIIKLQKSRASPSYKKVTPPASWYPSMPEVSIELLVDGKSVANINGDYKRGMIKEALKPYTTKMRIGRKACILPVGEADIVAP